MKTSKDLVAGQGRMGVCLLLGCCCLGWLWPVPTPAPEHPKQPALPAGLNTAKLSKAGPAAYISAQEQAEPACSRML